MGQLADGRLGTEMLRSSKTLQPQKDTRRLALVSINPDSLTALNISALLTISVLAPSWPPYPFANSLRGCASRVQADLHPAGTSQPIPAAQKVSRLNWHFPGYVGVPLRPGCLSGRSA